MTKPAGRFWPTNLFRQPVSVTGVDQVAKGTVGLIERMWSRGMDGGTGTFIGGNGADPMYRFSGYVDYVTLALTRTVGASKNLRGDPNVALPATGGPVVISAASPGNAVMNQLAQLPPGFR